MKYLIKGKKTYVIIIIFLLLISITINDFYNIKIKNNYENLYEVEMFDLTQELIKNTDMLKKEVDSILTVGKINTKSGLNIFKTSEDMLCNYTQIRSKSINNSLYFGKFTLSEYNIIQGMNNFINHLSDDITNSNELNKSDIDSLSIISNICRDINDSLKNYKANSANEKHELILNKSWLSILNNISEISDKYSNNKLFK